jgi:hypothetical protein
MMSAWQDATSYSSSDTARIPGVFELRSENFCIKIHKINGCGDVWHVTCLEIGVHRRKLDTTDPEQAKMKALDVVFTKINVFMKEINNLKESVK